MPHREAPDFIREKIKDKPLRKKKLLHKGIATMGYAILFGFVSCLVFCVLRPVIEPWFETEPDPQFEIPKDTLTDSDQGDDSPGDQNEQEVSGGAKKGSKSNQNTVYITKKQSMTLDDFQMLQNKLYLIGNRVNRSVVTVTGVREGMDIFESPYEASGQASGLIIGNNGRELLVLTEYEVIREVKSVRITFIDNQTLEAEIKKYDANTGIAILKVPVEKISKDTINQIDVAVLGNSLQTRQGKMVVALGSPLGTSYSILTGNITSVTNTITTQDHNYTVFTTNIVTNERGNGVLVNTDGEVIGLFLKSASFKMEQNTLTAVSVSELKGVIEMLSNGQNIPYIGIKGSTVTDAVSREYDIPKGVYIKEAVMDSPAMTAGLQNGDVIVEMDGQKIATMEDYQQKLLGLKKGSEVKITVNRQGTKEYKKYTCKVEVGVLR